MGLVDCAAGKGNVRRARFTMSPKNKRFELGIMKEIKKKKKY